MSIETKSPGMRALEVLLNLEVPRKTTAEFRRNVLTLSGMPDLHELASIIERETHCVELAEALENLVAKIDEVDHTAIGDETDRVFPSYEFDDARAALAAYRGEKS